MFENAIPSRNTHAQRESSPAWTVIIPTFNRPQPLRRAIDAVLAMTPPPGEFELIVVDDGGEADLSFIESSDRLRLVSQPNAGPAAARNTGAAHARGRMLAFTDDDCAPAPGWLAALDHAMPDAAEPIALGGRTLNALADNPFADASQALVDYLYQVKNRDPRDAGFFTSNNLAVSAAGFHRIEGFDPGFPLAAGEDRDFCDRWRAHGMRLCYVPQAIVHHHHPLTLRTFWRQHADYGRGARRLREPCQAGQIPPPLERLSFYLRLVTHPLSGGVTPRALTRSALLGLTQAATIWGYIRFESKQKLTNPTQANHADHR